MTNNGRGVALLAEVAAVLARHGRLRCAPRVEEDEGLVTVTVTLHPESEAGALDGLELRQEVQYVADVATLRMLVQRYGMDPKPLEAALRKRERA